MSLLNEYSNRPRIPSVDDILSDFILCSKNDDEPCFTAPDIEIKKPKKLYPEKSKQLSSQQEEQGKDVEETYKKVADFLKQNQELTHRLKLLNESSSELCVKKENLYELINNIRVKINENEVNKSS